MAQESAERVAAFTRVYDEHRTAVHAYFVGRLGAEDAADLLQEAFLRVWRHLDAVERLSAPRQRAWIFTVARNLTVDSYRGRATRDAAMVTLRADTRSQLDTGNLPEDTALASERLAALDAAIRQLPETLRVVVAMHAVGALDSTQIGAALELPPGTVRYRLSTARRRLAAALRHDQEHTRITQEE